MTLKFNTLRPRPEEGIAVWAVPWAWDGRATPQKEDGLTCTVKIKN